MLDVFLTLGVWLGGASGHAPAEFTFWLAAVSNGLIAIAYYSIPLAMWSLVRQRRDLPFTWIFILFGSFILACGTTHILHVLTLWYPLDGLQAWMDAATAGISIVTAILVWPLVPQAVKLPSPSQLAAANQELKKSMAEREQAAAELSRAYAEMELRVRERTAELALANENLQADIRARQQTEAKLQAALRDLERSNQDLEQFAYMASHDLQEPLRMVASYTQLLDRQYGSRLDADGREFIAFAVDGATRMQHLISDLLAFSRVGTRAQAAAPSASAQAAAEAQANLRAAIQENGAVVTSDELPRVLADYTQLVQLFQNLIGNALKFHTAETPRIHLSARSSGPGEWEFAVRDNGIGIDPQYHERIFTIFQRLHTREEYAGAGLGLAICKRIVERHGGQLWVESQLGQGATFRFTLPAAA